jgi:hypothetical protein
MARQPDLPYEFVFCDVRMELPETYAWIKRLEDKLGIDVKRIGESLEDVIAEQNMLPSQHRRFCTKYGKIFPIRDFVGEEDAIQYLGIRADESDRAGLIVPRNIEAKYPLIELGLGIKHVYQILGDRGILPPDFFWERLYNAVLTRCPFYFPLVDGLSPWDRAAMFSWRSRSNCFNCFYQRRYEWIGLLEYHPDLFERAEQLEHDYGTGDRRPCNVQFTWIQGLPLPELRKKADEIFDRRVKQVCAGLSELSQGRLFEDDFNPITVTSCGLYCGK